MALSVGPERHKLAIAVLGGPTTVLDIGGFRVVVDPTFDPAGEHGYLKKVRPSPRTNSAPSTWCSSAMTSIPTTSTTEDDPSPLPHPSC
jgi:hypothetical protein